MTIQIIFLIAGLALIVFGADWLVDGASEIARKAGLSEFVIGLTIVGFGTSCPELVVSLTGAFAGNPDISIGNVLGSNIFNTLLILGITAMIAPIAISKENRRMDIPVTVAVSILLVIFALGHSIFGFGSHNCLPRWGGILFLCLFAIYIYYCFKTGKSTEEESGDDIKEMSLGKAILLCIIGLTGLILGGKFFVSSASFIAKAIGVSDKFIAITILAGGTSMPELATCIAAAVKKKDKLALGNILGSNVFNILLILGCSSVVYPLSFESMNLVDLGILLVSSMLLLVFAFWGDRDKLTRTKGLILVLSYIAYMTWLIATA